MVCRRRTFLCRRVSRHSRTFLCRRMSSHSRTFLRSRMSRHSRTRLRRRVVRGSRTILRPAWIGRARRARGRRGCVCMRRDGHRACGGHGRGCAVINGRQLTSVGACGVLVGNLVCRRLRMLFPSGRGLLRCRRCRNTTRAVEACSGRVVIHYLGVIGIVNHGGVHLCNCRVIRIVATLPCTAEETNSTVAKAVINPAIESNMRPPVAAVEAVKPAGKAPVGRCPQVADARW